jgi:7-carboxy-7-deazaguanine synthase
MTEETVPGDGLKISEIFLSLQGESTLAGLPFVFIRLAGCNLRCSWCDTRYAYASRKTMTEAAVLAEVRKFKPVDHVLVTGGEPLLQRTGAVSLMKALARRGYKVSLETNGSLDLRGVPKAVKIVMDLKPPSSGEAARNLYRNLGRLGRNDELKIVVASKKDYAWAKRTLTARKARTGAILLSPVAPLKPASLAAWILRDRLPVRLQLRLHKALDIR